MNFLVFLFLVNSFFHFSAEDGFPQGPVSGICQDASGNIWIAEQDGDVFCFDGYEINRKHHFNGISDALQLDGGYFCLRDNSSYNLFPGSDGRLFDTLPVLTDANRFAVLPEKHLALCSSDSLLIYDLNDKKSVRIALSGLPQSGRPHLSAVTYSNGSLIFGYSDGQLFRCDISGKVINLPFDSQHHSITCMMQADDSRLLIGTRGSGLFIYDTKSCKVVRNLGRGNGKKDLSSDHILCLCHGNPDELWIGTLSGLNIINTKTWTVEQYEKKIDDPSSLSHNTVRRLLRDNQGGMWIGTYYHGVNYVSPLSRAFKTIRQGLSDTCLNDDIVTCIEEGTDGRIWIGTNKGGVNCLDPRTDKIKYYFIPGDETGISAEFNDIKDLWCPSDGNSVYIGSHGSGLSLLNVKTGKIRRLDSPEHVCRIQSMPCDKLLIKDYNSFYIYDLATETYERTDEGIKDTDYKEYEKLTGLCGIVGLEKDVFGNLWLVTERGLFLFKPFDGTLTSFVFSEVIPGIRPMKDAHYYSSVTGMMYFGGVGGIVAFDPYLAGKDIVSLPPPFISAVYAGGTDIWNGKGPIVLKSDDKYVRFKFSAPDYTSLGSDLFSCRIDGLDDDWYTLGSGRECLYSNIPPGHYSIRVRVSRDGINWKESEDVVDIIKRPVWYASPFFIVLWIFLFFLLLFCVIRMLTVRRQMKDKLMIQELNEKYKNDYFALKLIGILNFNLGHGHNMITNKSDVDSLCGADRIFLEKVLEMVGRELSNPGLSVEMIAEELGVSRMTLHLRIKNLCGLSALEFVKKMRFCEACRLLKETDLNVAQISYKVGARSPAYFNTSFKNFVGCTPLEYRKRK